MSKISNMSFTEVLKYTTKDNYDAVITVGSIKDGKLSYKVSGENGSKLDEKLHTYEIGSITKNFTAALVNKAINEGKINLDMTIDNYLELPDGNKYPTIKELLTHTSGYTDYYFESPMIKNFLIGKNDFYGISRKMALDKASNLNMNKENYDFNYSNYGYAILGLVLEKVYNTNYTALINNFIKNEIGLSNTKVSDKDGDLKNYWTWKADDAYLSAGAITSNINDILSYAQMQLENNPNFIKCHKPLEQINLINESYKTMDIRMDEIGMSWIIDNKNDIIWHNGGTGDYNSYIGFNIEKEVAVVILSNLPPNYRIPSTVLGIKLLLELKN